MENHFDVIVLGAGAAGLTAGIYLSRAKIKTLIINEGTAGGQMILTHEIANYPGVENISGFQLARNMKLQAQNFGCKIRANVKVTSVNLGNKIKSVTINEKESFTSDAVIIATGGRSRELNIPGETKFKGRGISYCATCDGDFFTNKEIIVVGGGNSALEEADSLTKYASKVTIVHEFDKFQALEQYVLKAESNSKIHFIMESKLTEIIGDEKLHSVKIQNQKNGEISTIDVDGVFIFIGYIPNTEKFDGTIKLSEKKEIVVDNEMNTSIDGVFAAGDVITKRYRQVTTSVADGTIAAMSAIEYCRKQKEAMTV